jgi:NAD(P)-dependent dehydrogenase (short-subunit alcohol dehydrogenase family)
VILITGANSGIGYEAALPLAAQGAQVIMACRSVEKGERAADEIRRSVPDAQLDVMALDLASLDAVRAFAAAFNARYDRLDVLINNAGVMGLPYRQTADGFEMQFGTNHLGHFALTGLLLERLLATPGARVVNVSSGYHRMGTINFDDLQSEAGYGRWNAYAQSKLANLLFAFELQRRLSAVDADVISVGCHPGYAATNLQTAGAKMEGSAIRRVMSQAMNVVLAQSAAMGALPILYAAVGPDVQGCDYIGPNGLMGMRGYPTKEQAKDTAYDEADARRLWDESVELTGVDYAVLAGAVTA